jgi:hypothetical protein
MNLEILGLILFVIIYNLIASALRKKNSSTFYCGLIGFSGVDNYNLDKIKFLMLWNSLERGKDSTGMFTPESGIVKKAELASKFFIEGEDRKVEPSTILIAHVRAKTVGINNLNNAHPFKKENITLAHNGTLLSYSKLANEYNMKFSDYDVDSQVITEGVFQDTMDQKYGELKNLKILEKYEGAAALLFHNEFTPDLLYAYRDTERPLFRGYDDEGNMYISSLKDTLEALNLYVIESFKENTLYTIQSGKILNEEIYITKRVIESKLKEEEDKLKKSKEVNKENKVLNFKSLLNESERGLKSMNNTVSNINGSWLMVKKNYTCSVNSVINGLCHHKEEANEWVFVEKEERCGDVEYISVIKDQIDDSFKFIYNHELDYENFLPKKGDYVIAMTTIVSKKDKIQLWSEGEAFEILEINYKNKTVEGNYQDKSSYDVPFSLFRVMNTDERIQNEEEILFNTTDEKFEDDPFVDSECVNIIESLINSSNDDDDDDNSDIEDIIVDYEVHCALLSEINDQIDFIEEKYCANLDITIQINEIKSILSKGLSKDYLDLTKEHKNNTKC